MCLRMSRAHPPLCSAGVQGVRGSSRVLARVGIVPHFREDENDLLQQHERLLEHSKHLTAEHEREMAELRTQVLSL